VMQTRPQPHVSVVVLNLEGEDVLPDALSTLADQNYQPLEILVVDNGSNDGSREVAARYPVKWVPLPVNVGFAEGNNIGARAAHGEIVVFVNNDMRFAPDFVRELVLPLFQDPQLFATDARQWDWTGHREIHLATRLRPVPFTVWLRTRESLPLLEIQQLSAPGPVNVFQACAGNMAVRRDRFLELGGFDARYPGGFEDTDIAWRSWLRGWRTIFVPSAECWHRVGVASATPEGRSARYRSAIGGRLLLAWKLLPPEHVAITSLLTVGGVMRDLLGGRFDDARKRAAVIARYGPFLPAVLRERFRLYGTGRSTPRRHLRRLFGVHPAGPTARESDAT
jgi:GT2 family glycosyltransferase